jgi:hypothetical protein
LKPAGGKNIIFSIMSGGKTGDENSSYNMGGILLGNCLQAYNSIYTFPTSPKTEKKTQKILIFLQL